MTIEILSIGSELLSGQTVNSNAALIGRVLLEAGYRVTRIVALPDELDPLTQEMKQAVRRASLVIVTGGLGPTQDDQTRKVIATLANQPLETDQPTARALKKRYGDREGILRYQADIPKGAKMMPNHLGTATGFAIELEKSLLIALPGVPAEMELMLKQEAMPLIAQRVKKQHKQKALFFCLRHEYQFDQALREMQKTSPQIEMGICPSYGVVSIYLKIQAASEPRAVQKLEEVGAKIEALFPTHFFSSQTPQIEIALQQELEKAGKMLTAVESCTGGRIAARITGLPGSSRVFDGGIVAYSNELKQSVLEVAQETLQQKGAVSRETVTEMVQGAFLHMHADYALATSGVAGPDGGTAEKPVGTIWVALGDRQQSKIYSHCLHLPAKMGRSNMMEYVTTYLLATLWRYLAHREQPFKDSQ